MTETTKPDWERIESDYRAGILSLREIAKLHPQTNHVAIDRRAKKFGWVRDLNAKIQAKADDLVTKQVVTAAVTEERLVSDKQAIEINAQAIADIRIGHRTDISKAKRVALSLLEELEVETGSIDLFNELGILLRSEDDKGQDKRNDLYCKVIANAGRVDSMKKLAETLNVLITLERKAWNISDGTGSKDETAENLATRLESARKRMGRDANA